MCHAHPSRREVYWLLAEPYTKIDPQIKQFIGWVDCRHCLSQFGADDLEALVDEKTSVHRKCMLVNTLQDAREKGVGGLKDGVKFFDSAGAWGRDLDWRALFDIYYVYGEDYEPVVRLEGYLQNEGQREVLRQLRVAGPS